MKKVMEKITKGQDLSEEEMIYVMEKLVRGDLSSAQVGAFLTALKMKGESISEITGGAKVMREKAESVNLKDVFTLDTCGTGGDLSASFNISTATSFICAAAGIHIAKHGNRSVSSKSGSADVLEALGVNINLNSQQVEHCVEKHHIGFFFAPTFHPAMKHAVLIRRELGYPTIFNMLGPLTNPANVDAQLIGVYDKDLALVFAQVLNNLGTKHALIVHGMDGLDEITISTCSQVVELKEGEITSYKIHPGDFGLEVSSLEEIRGGDPVENAGIIRDIYSGVPGPERDITLLNSGAALYLGKKAASIHEGIDLAANLIDKGMVTKKLDNYIKCSQELGRSERIGYY